MENCDAAADLEVYIRRGSYSFALLLYYTTTFTFHPIYFTFHPIYVFTLLLKKKEVSFGISPYA